MLVPSATRNKAPQRKRPLHLCSLLYVTVVMTVCRLAIRFSSSLDVLTKVTRCNTFRWQYFAKADMRRKKKKNTGGTTTKEGKKKSINSQFSKRQRSHRTCPIMLQTYFWRTTYVLLSDAVHCRCSQGVLHGT